MKKSFGKTEPSAQEVRGLLNGHPCGFDLPDMFTDDFQSGFLWSSTKDYRLALQLFLSIPASLCILFSCFLTGNVIVRLLRYKCNWFAEGLLIRVVLIWRWEPDNGAQFSS